MNKEGGGGAPCDVRDCGRHGAAGDEVRVSSEFTLMVSATGMAAADWKALVFLKECCCGEKGD